ncbi:MAG: CCXG family PEP-CTERM protein [Spirochaetaceae bacterium]|nr:CCXG family PEP-CTERM protein [Myxococcales bacterium]MCB9724288.1 CCXG family PEP-CTERM protein [Spirochaetaceae bacterium]HPG25898.1 CCXG family PEP-CTERM protein [Myxococcota bacterium]
MHPFSRAQVAFRPPARAPHTAGTSPRLAGLLIAGLLLFLAPASASALAFQADFVSSTYQVGAGDTFADLLAVHQSSPVIQSTTTTGLENISTAVYAAGVTSNYSILLQVDMTLAVAGTYTFQVGTDWGRGGGMALVDNATNTILSEMVRTDDVWWANDWNNPDVFQTTFSLAAGDSYSILWVGFEGCCGGTSTVRFSVDGGAFAPLTDTNFQPYVVPEPSVAVLLGLGLGLLARSGRVGE